MCILGNCSVNVIAAVYLLSNGNLKQHSYDLCLIDRHFLYKKNTFCHFIEFNTIAFKQGLKYVFNYQQIFRKLVYESIT